MTNQPLTDEVADRIERTYDALERAIASDEAKRATARKEARADFLDAFGRRRNANGVVVDVHGRDRGTAQTRTKLRPDTLVLLLNRGPERGLSQEQYDAAHLIRTAVRIIVGGMGLKACSMERMGGGGRSDGETETQWAIRVQEDYNAWVDAMAERAVAAKRARRDSRAWQTGPVMDIVVDGMTCNEVEGARCMRNGSAAAALRDALDLYLDVRRSRKRA
ncbi:hypothetical protein TSH58p_22745 (plasmid) [Azospirillum sp. TSH58]|uniref:hypothetical protein n=1 Tax=Azospirillum sp. TSH58 TaxID=664962 RepID=UPI000D60257D|nr:hypothetical protein [Azospirillum sp. TSH58]AWJ86336.1 hypothetical protein TSH58p_22745 [Azospirillum sp. TSH58]PWC73416.1 hypothetical protein TSH58_04370 [Azospirillum sp. TSH58]